jgi:hypothetical protein
MLNSDWQPHYLLWPRKVDGRWRWLSYVQRRYVACGCALYGDFEPEYRTC